jgi:hypothetical protein
MTDNVVVVYMDGGCYNGYDSDLALDVHIFDWDDFADDPITYWEDYPELIKTVIQKHNPELYASVLESYQDAKAEAAEEKRSIPFHDVPDLSRNQPPEN